MNKERLMSVLIQPHRCRRRAGAPLRREAPNQYVFRVLGDATKGDVKAAVELMFEVKVEGVNLLNKPGKTRRFKNVPGKRNGHQESLRPLAGRPVDRLHRHREVRIQGSWHSSR